MSEQTVNTANLQLVRLEVSVFDPTRTDAPTTAGVIEDNGVKGGSATARVVKRLVPKAEVLALAKLATETRAFIREHSTVWDEDGYRLVRANRLDGLVEGFHTRKAAFDQMADDFVARWDEIRAKAKVNLNGLFRDEDYPPASKVREKFRMKLKAHNLPDVGGLRGVCAAYDDLRAENETRIAEAIAAARLEPLRELADILKRVSDTLAVPDRIFRDTLINNLNDLLAREGDVNVTDDPQVSEAFAKARAKLSSYTPESLRKDGNVRTEAHNAAVALGAEIEALVSRKLEL